MTTLRAPDRKEEARKEDDRLLPLVAQAVRDIYTAAELVGAFEERLHAQVTWLLDNEGHPKYQERFEKSVESGKKHEELLCALYDAGATLHRRLAHLSAEGRRRAEDETPGVGQGINFARLAHYRHSQYRGSYYHLLYEGERRNK